MPSNTDLIKAIGTISAELEKDAPETEGKNNGELANILSGLKAEKKEAEAKALAEAEEAEAKALAEAAETDSAAAALKAKNDAKAKAAKPAKKPPFYVMPGKCLTSKRGMLATERDAGVEDYAEIKAEDLAGGKEALDAFVESGHVGKA